MSSSSSTSTSPLPPSPLQLSKQWESYALFGIPAKTYGGGVGANLQDHPAAVVSYTTKKRGVSVTSRIRLLGTRLPSPSAGHSHTLSVCGASASEIGTS